MIFYHNSTGGVFFDSFSEAMNCDKDSRYSIFSLISHSFLTEGYYEFLLEYPETVGFNHWRQSLLPWNDNEVLGNKAQGYQGISISWNKNSWGGLVLSNNYFQPQNNMSTLLDGSAGTNDWWFSIGCVNPTIFFYPMYPGPGVTINTTYLWLRIDNLNVLSKSTNNLLMKKSLIQLFSLLIFFL